MFYFAKCYGENKAGNGAKEHCAKGLQFFIG